MDPSDDEDIDRALMAAVARQDARAYATLVRRHLAWALRFVGRMVGARPDAEDVVQTGFLRVWQGAARWEPDARFRTWFYRVLYNLCMDHFRAHGVPTDALDDTLLDDRPSNEDQLFARQRSERVRQALAALPVRQRAALVLRYYEERSQAEAAGLLGVSEGALESLLSRGRAALKKNIGDLLH
ncbi:MAG: sigma-70 family RNA polymerase sigma factor [Burkholderiales bacterium]